ncbi:MAG: ATP-binding cassette subfamily F protein 3 [Saprospiraceae bacterium]|jgi:ATP-binding cassette subfamily F protein 3
MLTATNIFVQYGERILLNNVNLVITERDKIGLVGRNGAGKSTLLKIIAGDQSADSGTIARPSISTLGFLHQEMSLPKGKTVMDETMSAFADLKKMEKELAEMNNEISTRTDYESAGYEKLLIRFTELNDRYYILGGDNAEAEAERVLKGLGFKQTDFVRLTDEFSGGWQMRIELTKMLLQKPDYLLLDEPTNHLDIESIIWLEGFLADYPGAVITISHDKQFLDNVTKRTVEVELGKLQDYKAAFSEYMELRKDRREKQMASYENQQKMIAQREKTINRFMAKATKTKMAQSMKKQLDKMDRVEIAAEDKSAMNLRFPAAPRSGAVTLEGKNVKKAYGELLVLNGVDFKMDRGDRVAFVGQNGQGKTTLAKIIVDKLKASAGEVTLGHNVEIGYYAQNQAEELPSKLTLLETMEMHSPPEMRTRLRSILGAFLFSGEDAEKKVSVLSGGERARLALACLLLRPFNLLVLDEPTNHLDMSSKDILKQAIADFDGTLIVVSHDRDFLAGMTTRTLEFRDKKLHNHLGDVNYFLEKRRMDNMREVELSKSKHLVEAKEAEAAAVATPLVELSYDERKQLLRAVSNSERKIGKLEEGVEKINLKMAEVEFYQDPNHTKEIEKLADMKNELTTVMEEWEAAQERLDAAGVSS